MPEVELSPVEVDRFVEAEYPAAYHAGIRCVDLREGYATARWVHDPDSVRPGGLISGPSQFIVADSALWFLSFTILGLAPMAVTSDLHMTFLRPAAGGDLIAKARLLRAGRTRIVGDVSISVEGGIEVSHAIGSYAVLEPK